jgi:hypothetical protein
MNISEFISQVRSSNKYIFDDNLITDRQIFNTGRTIASLLVKQEINKRRLLNSDNVFTPIECLDLKLVDLTECGVDSCNKGRRSVEQLPELEEGIFGYTIQGVYNLDNSQEIFPTTLREYINLSKLRRKPQKEFYLIKNRYLYILNPDIEAVNIYLYSPDNTFELDACESMYEGQIKLPNYLKKSFYDLVNAELLNYHKFGKDVTDDNLDQDQ